jgi:DNA-binding NarL/FixJ family response regulator
MDTVRIVTADDHPILRDGLRRLLEAEPGLEVVGEAGSGAEAIRLVAALSPHLLLLDLAMPDVSGLDVLRALHQAGSTTRTVILTASADKEQLVEALLLGARGLLLKDSATALLYKCVKEVVAGGYWLGHDRLPGLIEMLRRLGCTQATRPAGTLTPRELHVVAAVLDGATNRDISTQLGLSEQTVKNHLSHIFDKVGVSNRLELALFAIHHRVLDGLALDPAAKPAVAALQPSRHLRPPRRGGSLWGKLTS